MSWTEAKMSSYEYHELTQMAMSIELGPRAFEWLEGIYLDGWTPLIDLQYCTEEVGMTHKAMLKIQGGV